MCVRDCAVSARYTFSEILSIGTLWLTRVGEAGGVDWDGNLMGAPCRAHIFTLHRCGTGSMCAYMSKAMKYEDSCGPHQLCSSSHSVTTEWPDSHQWLPEHLRAQRKLSHGALVWNRGIRLASAMGMVRPCSRPSTLIWNLPPICTCLLFTFKIWCLLNHLSGCVAFMNFAS